MQGPSDARVSVLWPAVHTVKVTLEPGAALEREYQWSRDWNLQRGVWGSGGGDTASREPRTSPSHPGEKHAGRTAAWVSPWSKMVRKSSEETLNFQGILQCRRSVFHPWVRKIPWTKKWQLTPVFSPGKSHGQRSLEAIVHGVTKSWTQMINTLTFHFWDEPWPLRAHRGFLGGRNVGDGVREGPSRSDGN